MYGLVGGIVVVGGMLFENGFTEYCDIFIEVVKIIFIESFCPCSLIPFPKLFWVEYLILYLFLQYMDITIW